MVATVEHLMNCGFRAVYGYTQSDKISLLLHRDEEGFGRKLRKLNSVLAGEASAKFSLLLGSIAAFDCRISQLPTLNLVVDYFRWRNKDAHRNALNAHCYWTLRKDGESAGSATEKLHRLSASDKILTFEEGGKKSPVFSGYRPQCYYDGHDWDALHNYVGVEKPVYPGQTVVAHLSFLRPQYHTGHLCPGKEFLIREGQRVVARGRVTKILELNKLAKAAKEREVKQSGTPYQVT